MVRCSSEQSIRPGMHQLTHDKSRPLAKVLQRCGMRRRGGTIRNSWAADRLSGVCKQAEEKCDERSNE